MIIANNRVKSLDFLRLWGDAVRSAIRHGGHSRPTITLACEALVSEGLLPKSTTSVKNEVAVTVERLRVLGRIRYVKGKYEVVW